MKSGCKIASIAFFLSLFVFSSCAQASTSGLNFGTVTANTGLSYGDYVIYSDLGSNDGWARILITDSQEKTIDTSVITKGEMRTFSDLKFDIAVTGVEALQDGTVVGTDIAVDSVGKIKIGTIDADTSLVVKYNVYPTLAGNDGWVKVMIKDEYDNVLDTLIINEGETKESSSAGLAINANDVLALEDGTVLSVKLIVGKVGTVTAIDTLEYMGYSIYSDLGSTDYWAQIRIFDESDNSYLPIIINEGSTRTFLDFYIKVLDVRALQDGTIVGVDLIIGNSKSVKTNGFIEHSGLLINSDSGADNEWASIKISNMENVVDTLIINRMSTRDSNTNIRIGVSDVDALQDGTVIGTGVVIGSIDSEPPTTTTTTTTPEAVTTTTTIVPTTIIPTTTTTTTPEDVTTTTTTTPEVTTTTTTIVPTTTTTVGCPSGCIYNETCFDFGIRILVDNTPEYCNPISKTFESQIGVNATCQNNYECLSNSCSNGACVEPMSLLTAILNALKGLIDFFSFSWIR